MIDPKLNTLPVDGEGDFEEFDKKTLTREQAAALTKQARSGLSINDTIAATASMSVGARGADTSGVETGAGVGAGTTYLGPGVSLSGSPAPQIVPAARAAGSTMRGEAGYGLESSFALPTVEEISSLAYDYWAAKGYPDGSHEEDWRQAEEELFRRRQLARATGVGADSLG
jgi:hypothetical protein